MMNAWINFINTLNLHQLDMLDDALTDACLKANNESREEDANLLDAMADLVGDQIDYIKEESHTVAEMEEMEANRYC